jgi:hypothetical protein
MNSLLELTPQQLRRAADLKDTKDKLVRALTKILGIPPEIGDNGATPKRKRRMSAAGRAKIAAAARKRWRKAKAQGKTSL